MALDEKGRVAGLPEGAKACHRFFIPMSMVSQGTLGKPEVIQQAGFVPCIKENCMLWNPHPPVYGSLLDVDKQKLLQGECHDVTRSRALVRLVDLKWNEVTASED